MGNTIDQISELLNKANLPWLLTHLRQNIVIWEQWNDPVFFEKVIQSKPAGLEFTQADFSPSRLALLALDQYNALDKNPGELFESIDGQTLQAAIRNFNDQSLINAATQNFESTSLAAIAMAYKYHITRSWYGLVDAIREHPESHWHTPLACLYGLVDDPAGLIQALVQPGASELRVELAVHTVLSNPLAPIEQVEKLVCLTQSPQGDLLPARERLILLHTLHEQQRELAADFSRQWLSLNQDVSVYEPKTSLIESINQLTENHFLVELYKVTGDTNLLTDLLQNEKVLSKKVTAGTLIHYTAEKSVHQSDPTFGEELSAIREQIFPQASQETGSDPFPAYRAALALTLADQGRLDEAMELLPDSVAPLPDEVNTLFAIAKASFKAGNHERAQTSAARLMELLDQKEVENFIPVWGEQLSLVSLGKLMMELRSPDKASRIFNLALKVSPSDTVIIKLLADSLLSSHKQSQACEALHVLVAIQPKNIEYRRLYAQALEDMADWDGGLFQRSMIIDIYQEGSKTIPAEDVYAYASTALQADQPELTIQVCEKILVTDPEDSQALIYSGKAYLRTGNPAMGMEFLIRATQASPHIAEAWLALADAQRVNSTTKIVIDTLTSAATAVPNSAEIHFALGETYLRDKAPTLALPELNAAVELSPENPKILFDYAKALQQLGHREDSGKALSRAYSLDPYLPGLAQTYAHILFEMGRLEEAIPPLELLIDQKAVQDPEPYMEYARSILMYNKTAEVKIAPMKALVALNEVLQIDPDIAEARALIAETLAANGDLEMAFQAYREALDTVLIDDKEWLERLSYGFGSVASSIGKYDIAIAALQEAGQANPDNPAIYKALSDAYLAANLLEDAVRSARYVLVIEGEEADNLAWFAGQAAKLIIKRYSDATISPSLLSKTVPDEALNALAKAIQLSPTRTDLVVQFGNFQALMGAQEEARMTFLSLASLDFAAIEDLKTAADYLSTIGDHAGAVTCLESGISINQKSPDEQDISLYVKLAGEHVKNNDDTSAVNTLDRAIEAIPHDSTLLIRKVELLLGLGQAVEALECIETGIQANTSDNHIELKLLAARINRCIGDLSAAYKYAQEGIAAAISSNGKEDYSGLPIHDRTLVAEIYRALLQPELAFRVIGGQPTITASSFDNELDYLDFICLHTELALDTGEQIRSDIQDIQPDSSHPAFSRVMAITARLMNKAGNFKQAEQIYQIAVNNFANRDVTSSLPAWSVSYSRYLTLNSLVEAAMDLGMWDQAQSGIKQILDTTPNEPLSYLQPASELVLRREYYNLGEALQVSNHKPGSEIISEQALESYKENLNHARSLIEQYFVDDSATELELNLDSIIRWQARAEIAFNLHEDTSTDPVEILAQPRTAGDKAALIAYLHQTDTQSPESDSISRIIKYARSYSRNPAVILQVALAIQDDNPVDAKKSLQTVLEQNPYAKNHVIAFCQFLLAEIASGLNDYDTAQNAVEKALEYWQDEPAWHAMAARVYKNSSDTGGAITHLVEAARLDPNHVNYHLELAKTYYETAFDDVRILKLAQKSIEKVLGLDADNLEGLVLSANIQCQLNDYENAEMNARSALAMAPNRADIHQLLSEIAIRSSDFQGAYEYANKALQLNSKDVQSTITLARSLSALGRHNEALTKLNAVLPIAPDSKSIYLERVNIVRKVNGARAGIDELKTLSETYPEDFNIINALARAYLEVGELDEAINHAQLALKACSDSTPRNEQANLHLLIGQVLHQSGQLDQSIQHLEEAIQLAPDRLEPYLELGLARKERREYQQALQIFEQATSIDPEDPRAPFQAGLALKESKDYKSSEMMLRRAVSLAPHDLNIRRQLAAVVALNLVHNPRSGRN